MHFYPSVMDHHIEMKTEIASLNLLFSCKSQFLSLLALRWHIVIMVYYLYLVIGDQCDLYIRHKK
jgi:hypothetical protein